MSKQLDDLLIGQIAIVQFEYGMQGNVEMGDTFQGQIQHNTQHTSGDGLVTDEKVILFLAR